MKTHTTIIVIAISMLLCSCVSTYQVVSDNGASDIISKSDNVLVLTPEDAMFGSIFYAGSGKSLAMRIATIFREYGVHAKVSEAMDMSELAVQDVESADFIVIPEIYHWEDRATVWSAIADKSKIAFTVYDKKKDCVASTIIKARGPNLTFCSQNPLSILEKPLSGYINKIVR